SSSMKAVDPHAVLAAFAKFGDPPATIWQAPAYAMRVMARRRVLERQLADARHNGSRDVPFCEAALRMADVGSVRAGIAVAGAMTTLAVLLVFAIVQVVSAALGP